MPDHSDWQVQYLRVIGRLYADGRVRLRPSYLTPHARWSDPEDVGDSPLRVELTNAAGEALGRYPLRLYRTCAFGGSPSHPDAVRGWVPFHPDTRMLRFTYRDRVVHEVRREEHPPRVRLTWQAPERVEGRQRITWDVAARRDTESFLRYSHDGGRHWQRVGWRTAARHAELDVDELPGGERCVVAVVVTDGIDTTSATSAPFAVRPKACRAFILSPIDGTVFAAGQPVPLAGQGFWLEGARVEREHLHWRSSIDGDLGHGAQVTRAQLSPGRHEITLVAGAGDRDGTESVTITVAELTV